MLDKIKKISEVHLSILITAITACVLYCAYQFGDANLEEMSNRGLRLSAFMIYSVSLIKCLGTFDLDVWKEIITEHNMALAVVLGALLIGGAACILL